MAGAAPSSSAHPSCSHRPRSSAFTPVLLVLISLLPPITPSLLLFPFPFSSLPLLLHFLADSQAFRPQDAAAFAPSRLPLTVTGSRPCPPAASRGVTEGCSWSREGISSIGLLPLATPIPGGLLGFVTLLTKSQLLNAAHGPITSGGAFSFLAPLQAVGTHGPGSAQGLWMGSGLFTELLLFHQFIAYGPFSCFPLLFFPSILRSPQEGHPGHHAVTQRAVGDPKVATPTWPKPYASSGGEQVGRSPWGH